ncbi:MAG: leucyl aminopeptidase family protein [Saprospiraceae bacterium]|nr:leucyl aminopeptidase family protein [Saprospiraceae bacterium]MDW8483622.1 leucyl aminopeptidase family protein [Saprospiraceae bacterium]
MKKALQRGVTSCCFPQTDRIVFVCFLDEAIEASEGVRLEKARQTASQLLRDIRHYKLDAVGIVSYCPHAITLAFLEGLVLSTYQFTRHYSQPEKRAAWPSRIYWICDAAPTETVHALNALIEAVFLTRDLVNEPHSHLDTLRFVEAVCAAAERYGFSAQALEAETIQQLGMGGLLAVGRASEMPPQFCILEWKPTLPRNKRPIVLVGKGIVYDTGGLSLKTPEAMEIMKCDMAGAAAVLGIFCAVAQTRLPIHLIGLLPITDNKVGSRSLVPGDVIRMYSGTTVEVTNTDAEGRLILADALHYAKRYDPELVLDIATLTGAAVRALGHHAICYMGTAEPLIKQALETSGMRTYERLVELPLWEEYGEDLKSNVADLKNMGHGPAGMITAGKFLQHFTDYPWLHLDIAGPAYLRAPNGYRPKDGTGVGVRLLFDFLQNYPH